jgi:hypothetical protein
MTVCRRPVASWKPQSVGHSGLVRVGTRKTGVKVPLRHGRFGESPRQGLARSAEAALSAPSLTHRACV